MKNEICTTHVSNENQSNLIKKSQLREIQNFQDYLKRKFSHSTIKNKTHLKYLLCLRYW